MHLAAAAVLSIVEKYLCAEVIIFNNIVLFINISFITIPLQALELVVERLKLLRRVANTSLADNIPPALTSDIWTSAANESYLSCTMHVFTKDFMLHTYSMAALPLYDFSHNLNTIADMWLRVCTDTLAINDNRMQPIITTARVANKKAAGCKAGLWYWMWCT